MALATQDDVRRRQLPDAFAGNVGERFHHDLEERFDAFQRRPYFYRTGALTIDGIVDKVNHDSGHLLVVSGQWSVVSGQWSVVSGATTVRCRRIPLLLLPLRPPA